MTSITSIHIVWPNNIHTCESWPFANTRVLVVVITLMATGKHHLQKHPKQQKSFTCRASESVAQPTSGSVLFFAPIVIMIADKDLSCCSVASRVSSRQMQNLSCKCPMCPKPHPSCIDLRQALPPQSPCCRTSRTLVLMRT